MHSLRRVCHQGADLLSQRAAMSTVLLATLAGELRVRTGRKRPSAYAAQGMSSPPREATPRPIAAPTAASTASGANAPRKPAFCVTCSVSAIAPGAATSSAGVAHASAHANAAARDPCACKFSSFCEQSTK